MNIVILSSNSKKFKLFYSNFVPFFFVVDNLQIRVREFEIMVLNTFYVDLNNFSLRKALTCYISFNNFHKIPYFGKPTHGFVPRPLLCMIKKFAAEFRAFYGSWSSRKRSLEPKF